MHAYHEALPNFIPEAIWHTGCPECEHRSGLPFAQQVGLLDSGNRAKAVSRATAWQRGLDIKIDEAEVNLLRNTWAAMNMVGMLL